MKNIVEEMIQAFSRQELREFRYFLGVSDNNAEYRRDLQFVDNIRTGHLCSTKNINADHQTRKRLKKKLEQFAVLENIRHDKFSRIHAQMETAKYLFRKNLYRQAWDYLLKAEAFSAEADEYKLLEYNHDMQIAYSCNVATQPPKGFSIQQLLTRWDDNRSLAVVDSNANAAYALLVHKLREQFAHNLSIDIDKLTDSILRQYGLNDSVYDNNLRIYCKIVNLVCRMLREKREYTQLKNYAIDSYKRMDKKRLLTKVSDEFVLDLLDAICIGTLRSGDYKNCEKYTRLYEAKAQHVMARPDEHSYYDFIQYVGAADLFLCTNRLPEAHNAMLTAKKKYAKYQGSIRIAFLLRINLIAVHFSLGDFEMCIKLNNELKILPEKKILAEPGFRLELLLFSDIYAIIFHFEEEEYEYASYILEKIKRKYSTILKLPESAREKLLLTIMEKILNKPGYLKTEAFYRNAEQVIAMRKFVPGDFEYISFNAWLISKMTGQSYYDSFLRLV